MTIVYETKWKKQDGTEVKVVPLKDIVVTAPGYSTYGYNNDWRVEMDNDAHQSTQLYESAMKKMPRETDTWECISMHQSSDGGNATYRAYIEKAKVPALRENIRRKMIMLWNPYNFFARKGKVTFSDQFRDCYQHHAELVVKNARGHIIKDELSTKESMGKSLFFFPDYRLPDGERVEGLGIKYDIYDGKLVLRHYSFESLSSILEFCLNPTESGLLDKIRAKILREIARGRK